MYQIMEYIELLILSYFKNHSEEYSLQKLRSLLGISFSQLDEIIDEMISNGLLIYDDFILRISFEGRIKLMKSSMERYEQVSEIEIREQLLKEPWPIDKPYMVKRFSRKKWRNK